MSRYIFFCVIISCLVPAAAHGDSKAYLVKKGDTLYRISREFGVPVAVLKAANRRMSSENLAVGQTLLIPESYTVKKGDTLYGIGRRYGVGVDDIVSLNGLSRSKTLKVNQKIYIMTAVNEKAAAQSGPAPDAKNPIFWPLAGARESYHGKMRGVLITGEKGDLVYSVSTGTVIWADPYRGFGNVVLVDSGDGLVYGYLGIEDLIVSAGEKVESGSALGRIGVYFQQSDAKLLFIVYHNVKRLYLDPQEVLYTASKPKQ
ncbi:MAG: M23 family metallopeptidase [Spirochaetales bacterium]|nr:M23 family metallopeptidase [Spirochaetales bacterium]